MHDPLADADIEIRLMPNPVGNKTRFQIHIPQNINWQEARIIIYDLSGRPVDFIPLTVNPWAPQEIRADWYPDHASVVFGCRK